jgi:hypothetical protein
MNHLNSRLLMSFAGVLAVAANNASAQMSMRQSMPMVPQADLNARQFVSEEQWINSIVDHWTGSQRKSWHSLDPHFRGWVSHLVWVRKTVGRPSSDSGLQGPRFHAPSACPADAFAAPVPTVAESMDHFRNLMPDINWSAWTNIEPTFRGVAEWEMSAAHAKALVSKALKNWWELNIEKILSCLHEPEEREAKASSRTIDVVSAPRSLTPNPRFEQIDRRATSDRRTADHMIAPEPMKQEVREQISDAATVDKYIADMDRRKP